MIRPWLEDITVEITNKCNLRCQVCDIWMEKSVRQVASAELFLFLSFILDKFRIRSVSVTGGEPFLHPEISNILSGLARLVLEKKIMTFGVYTNGTRTEAVRDFMVSSARFIRGMNMGVSVDGVHSTHDFLRGRGAYVKTIKTIELMCGKYAELADVEIKFTANKNNFNELLQVYHLAQKYGARFSPKLAEDGVQSYYHRYPRGCTRELIGLNEGMLAALKQQLLEVIKEESVRAKKLVDVVTLKMLLKLMSGGIASIRACETPGRCLFVTSFGDVYPCLYMPPVGNALAGEAWTASNWKKRSRLMSIAKAGKCPRCWAYHGFLKEFNSQFLHK